MQAAYSEWHAQKNYAVRVPYDTKDASQLRVATLSPIAVITLDKDHRVLAVSGVPDAGHSTPGILNTYAFERRGERWVETGRHVDVYEGGFFGELGTVKPVVFGPGHVGISIENGSCWVGDCSKFLSLLEVTPEGVRSLLADQEVILSASNGDAHAFICDEAAQKRERVAHQQRQQAFEREMQEWDRQQKKRIAKGIPQGEGEGDAPPEDNDRYEEPSACLNVLGTWRISDAPADSGYADLLLHFRGLSSEPENSDAESSAQAHGPFRKVDEAVVMRFDGQHYLAQGKLPTHGW